MEINVRQGILSKNETTALENKKVFDANDVFVINLMGSPGAGKTTLLEKTLERLAKEIKTGVIEGDIYTSKDADRIEKYNVPVKQINTGGACHLDARMIEAVLGDFNLKELDLLIIENVGNLVCPVEFNLGEDMKIAVLSVVEGDDKPLKYPLIFKESAAVVLNKIDLADLVDINLNNMKRDILAINPEAVLFEVSSRLETGLDRWCAWLKEQTLNKKTQQQW